MLKFPSDGVHDTVWETAKTLMPRAFIVSNVDRLVEISRREGIKVRGYFLYLIGVGTCRESRGRT